jgi:hypothetical protein
LFSCVVDLPVFNLIAPLSEAKNKLKEYKECLGGILGGLNVKKILQVNRLDGDGLNVWQMGIQNDEGQKLNFTQITLRKRNISNKGEKYIILVSKSPIDKNGVTISVLKKKTSEYKSSLIQAGENLLSVDVKNLENAEKVVKEFL